MSDDYTRAQLERCNDALAALKILATTQQAQRRDDASTIASLTSERDTANRSAAHSWASELTGALEQQAVREGVIALLAALRPVMETVLNREIREALLEALITLQLPDAGQRTADGGDAPRQHVVIVLSDDMLHVGQFREIARLIEALQHSRE